MAQLILHVGVARTGSSSIQKALWGSRRQLKEQGVLYPQTGSWNGPHHDFALAIRGNPTRAGEQIPLVQPLLQKLAQEAEASGCHTVVMSSDLFGFIHEEGDQPAVAERLGQLLNAFRGVRVVCFVRHQALRTESTYRFFVLWRKRPETGLFFEPLPPSETIDAATNSADIVSGARGEPVGRASGPLRDYLDIERHYRSIRPDIDFRYVGYHEAKATGLLVKSFFDRAGLSSCYSGEEKTNESLSRRGTLAVLMWNRGLVPATMRRAEFVDWARTTFPEQRESLYDEELLDLRASRLAPSIAELATHTGIDLGIELEEFRKKHVLCGCALTPEFQEHVLSELRKSQPTLAARFRKYLPFSR
jgi:hypothetical protein